MKIPPMLQGRLTRRLMLLFVVLGIAPIVVFTVIPALYQLNASQRAAARAAAELEQQTEEEMLRFARLSASRYSVIFAEEARSASLLARYAEQALGEPAAHAPLADPAFALKPGASAEGWRTNGPEAPVGLLVSPLAALDEATGERQAALSTASVIMKPLVDNDPYVRSAFIVTEDQTLWLYPNYLWQGGELAAQSKADLTTRPYYRETRSIVWSDPYLDIEPVISVAAPIWVNGTFEGMAGIDFALDAVVREVAQTDIGVHGFIFLISSEGDLITLPERAEDVLLGRQMDVEPGAILDQSLYEAVPGEVRAELEAAGINRKLKTGQPFITTLNLPGGPVYFVSAPLQNVPWHVAVVQPVEEVAGVTANLASEFRSTIENILFQSILSGLGFLIVVLLGGLITVRRLALPIQELSVGAQSIMRGNLGYRLPVSAREDEMVALTASFNAMAEAVQTMRDELQTALTRRETEFRLINDVASLTNRQFDLPQKLNRALDIARVALGTDILTLSLINNENDMVFTALASDEHDRPELEQSLPRCIDQKTLQHVAESRAPLSVPDVFDAGGILTPEQVGCFRQLDVHQLGLMPVVGRSRVLGVITLMRHAPVTIPEEKLAFLDALTRQIAVLIENAELQNQTRALFIMDERRRLASELHDSVTQSLFTLTLAVEGLKGQLGDTLPAEQQEVLDLVLLQTRTVQDEMRTLIDELRPVDLDEKGLMGALRQHAQSLHRSTDIDVEVSVHGDTRRLPLNVQRNLNRIAQEALSNVGRHSGATQAGIELSVGDDVVELSVRDNGHGFDPPAVARNESSSLGLTSMRERAEMMGGALLVRSAPGAGTRITARIPLLESPQEAAHG